MANFLHVQLEDGDVHSTGNQHIELTHHYHRLFSLATLWPHISSFNLMNPFSTRHEIVP